MNDASNVPEKFDWAAVDDGIVKEIVRQAEAFMSAQLQSSIAGDQRAFSLTGTMATVSTGLIGGGLTLLTSGAASNTVLGWAATIAGIVLVTGAANAAYATRPINFHFVGNHPDSWFTPEDLSRPLRVSLGEHCEALQRCIDRNEAALAAKARALRTGLWCCVLAPCAGAIAAITVTVARAAGAA
ncbi:MAG TPA: hypothetical protein VKQ29_05625 [Aliidongia sp.]|nr:hypothetical protein [Aliidongia sp.]